MRGIKQATSYAYAILVLLLFAYLILRAIYIPLAHDEAETFFIYFVNGHFLPYQGWVSANNHFLNSFLGHLCFLFFGSEEWSIRLPNLVFFPLYAIYLYRLAGSFIAHDMVRICTLLALISAPFFIEFFALARGYGMAMAFLLAYLFHLKAYLKNRSMGQFLLAQLLGFAMLLASLTCFYVFVLTSALLLLDLRLKANHRMKKGFLILLFNLLPGAFIIRYTIHLGQINELVVGTLSGMYAETIAPMTYWFLGSDQFMVVSVIILALAFPILDLAWRTFKHFQVEPILQGPYLMHFLLSGSLIIIAVNGYLLNIPFPRDRAALFLFPLLILAFAISLDRAGYRMVKYLSLLLLFFPANLLFTMNINHSHYWKTKRIDPAYYDYILAHSGSQIVTIGSASLRETIWYHSIFKSDQKLNPLYIENPEMNNETDFIISPDSINRNLGKYYNLIFEDEVSQNNLYQRRISMIRSELISDNILSYLGSDLYHDVALIVVDSSLTKKKLLLDLEVKLKANDIPHEFSLIVNGMDVETNILTSQTVRLSRLKYQWNKEEPTRLLINLGEPVSGTDAIKVFVLNNDERPYAIISGHYHLLELKEQINE
ncbi:MAG: hypothetical protein RIC15_10115 [Vicingaceae bacterium]